MNRRVVLVSYLIVLASAASMLIPRLLLPYSYYPYYGGFLGLFFPAYVSAVAGMILGPYFALAGLIKKNGSIWVEVNRMLHNHIYIPLIGGIVIFYESFFGYTAIISLLTIYALFVFLATLITVMAARAGKDSSKVTNASVA